MSQTCPVCGRVAGPADRWCGSCGASLPMVEADRPRRADEPAAGDGEMPPGPDGPDGPDSPSAPADGDEPRRDTTRRRTLQLLGAGALGLGLGWLARGAAQSDWVDVGRVDLLLDRIAIDGWVPAPGVGDDPSHAIVRWDPSIVRSDGLESRIVYASEPVVARDTGLMVLVLRSPHGGCDTHFCESSRFFEDVCFGSRFNGWGEYVGGPAPRSLDRRPARLVDGRLEVNRTGYTVGARRDRRMSDQEPAGPSCRAS